MTNYLIIYLLLLKGSGAFATVYRAHERGSKASADDVAVKYDNIV